MEAKKGEGRRDRDRDRDRDRERERAKEVCYIACLRNTYNTTVVFLATRSVLVFMGWLGAQIETAGV